MSWFPPALSGEPIPSPSRERQPWTKLIFLLTIQKSGAGLLDKHLPRYYQSIHGGFMETMVLNIKNFPADLQHEAKVAAVTEGKSLKDWIIEAVNEKLERDKAEQK
jgi:hypothetical protein